MGRQDGRSETFIIERSGSGVRVRRLTPLECERLMGLPDNYTLVKYKGRQVKDWSRYVAIGNSMAVPVVRWIGRRIDLVDKIARAPGASEKNDAIERPTVNYFDVVKGMGSTATGRHGTQRDATGRYGTLRDATGRNRTQQDAIGRNEPAQQEFNI
jgi:hypothetical protein